MPPHSCCEVRVMQLHDILLLRTSAILPEAISAGGLTPTTDTSLLLTTYRGGRHLPADILKIRQHHKKAFPTGIPDKYPGQPEEGRPLSILCRFRNHIISQDLQIQVLYQLHFLHI